MIVLHTFGPAFGQPDPSPFVMKAMALLKMSGQEFSTSAFAGGSNVGPKGKRPFIVDEGVTIADSTLIRFHLEKKYGVGFDSHLTPGQQGITWAIEKMCEEHLYFAAVYFRWMNEENFKRGPATFFEKAPALIRPFVRNMVRGGVRKSLHAQGLGRHSEAEISTLACRDLDALSWSLGDADWFGGSKPCAADASAGAILLATMCELFDSPLLTKAKSHDNLVAYVKRVQRTFFTD